MAKNKTTKMPKAEHERWGVGPDAGKHRPKRFADRKKEADRKACRRGGWTA